MMNEFEVLLSNYPGLGRIQLCSRNCIHFSVGPVTLNLTPSAFVQAATLVRNAMDELSRLIASGEATADPERPSDLNAAHVH